MAGVTGHTGGKAVHLRNRTNATLSRKYMVSLGLVKNQTIKLYGEAELLLHAILTFTQIRVNHQPQAFAASPLGKELQIFI